MLTSSLEFHKKSGMNPSLHASDLLDLDHQPDFVALDTASAAWEILFQLADRCRSLQGRMEGRMMGDAFIGEQVVIGSGTVIEPGAVIKGPAWIGQDCVIRPGCYIRENTVVGNGVVLGNSSEFKNCVVFDEAEIPHFNYVGDSVVGYKGHLGAGVILSNVRLDRRAVKVAFDDGTRVDTGLKKFGAIVGDRAEIGCNAVISPGSIIGRRSIVYPCAPWRGVLAEDSVAQYQPALRVRPRQV